MCHRLSGKFSKCPSQHAEIDPWRVRRNRFSMFLCPKWRNSWRKCRRQFPKTESSSGLWSRSLTLPVPQGVEEVAEVFRVFSQDRTQQRAVEQTTPATSLVEMIVEMPVARTPEKTQQVANTLVQHAVNTVEVERPQIIKQTWQKTHHPGENQPGDQADRDSTAAVYGQGH